MNIMEYFFGIGDMYDSGYEDNYDWVYERGIVFYDESDEIEGVVENSEDDKEIIENKDVILDCPSKDEEVGIA